MPKYEVFSGPYFPVFCPNAGKYGPEKTPYFATLNIVQRHRALCIPALFLLFFNSHLDRPLKLAPNFESNQVYHELLVLNEMSLFP